MTILTRITLTTKSGKMRRPWKKTRSTWKIRLRRQCSRVTSSTRTISKRQWRSRRQAGTTRANSPTSIIIIIWSSNRASNSSLGPRTEKRTTNKTSHRLQRSSSDRRRHRPSSPPCIRLKIIQIVVSSYNQKQLVPPVVTHGTHLHVEWRLPYRITFIYYSLLILKVDSARACPHPPLSPSSILTIIFKFVASHSLVPYASHIVRKWRISPRQRSKSTNLFKKQCDKWLNIYSWSLQDNRK